MLRSLVGSEMCIRDSIVCLACQIAMSETACDFTIYDADRDSARCHIPQRIVHTSVCHCMFALTVRCVMAFAYYDERCHIPERFLYPSACLSVCHNPHHYHCHPAINDVLALKGKRKEVYLYSAIILSISDMDHTVLPANYTMSAFPS